jgi:heterodisulfide reductase subunit D
MRADLLESIKRCAFCPKMCRFACPVARANKDEAAIPYGLSTVADLALAGKLDLAEPSVAGLLYACTECRACREYCRVEGVDLVEICRAVRAQTVARGIAPEPVARFHQKLQAYHNPYGARALHAHEKVPEFQRAFPRKARVLYYAGCTAAVAQPEIVVAAFRALERLGVDYTVLPGAWCCGLPALSLGNPAEARELMAHNLQAIQETGCQVVVSGCPSCVTAFRQDYPQAGLELEVQVLHISQYLDGLLDVSLTGGGPGVQATYQDPCLLGRGLGEYQAPRRLLGRIVGLELAEMAWSHGDSLCCGGGGGLPLTWPTTSRKMGHGLLCQAIAAGAQTLITACPFCKNRLSLAARRSPVRVLDLVEFLAPALG